MNLHVSQYFPSNPGWHEQIFCPGSHSDAYRHSFASSSSLNPDWVVVVVSDGLVAIEVDAVVVSIILMVVLGWTTSDVATVVVVVVVVVVVMVVVVVVVVVAVVGVVAVVVVAVGVVTILVVEVPVEVDDGLVITEPPTAADDVVTGDAVVDDLSYNLYPMKTPRIAPTVTNNSKRDTRIKAQVGTYLKQQLFGFSGGG